MRRLWVLLLLFACGCEMSAHIERTATPPEVTQPTMLDTARGIACYTRGGLGLSCVKYR